MYIFGGKDENNTNLNELWKYDILKQEWTELTFIGNHDDPSWCIPVGRSGHSCSVYGQYMVIFGGCHDITKELKDLYLFDFLTETWIPIFIEENSPHLKQSGAYNDMMLINSLNLPSGIQSALSNNKLISSNQDTFDNFPGEAYANGKSTNSHRIKTAHSTKRSSQRIALTSTLAVRRESSGIKTVNKEDATAKSNKSFLTISTRKLSSEQSRF
jgi:hypothetical protein